MTSADARDATAIAAFAESLADDARKTCLTYFRTTLEIDGKADASPVTIADQTAERAMRDKIEATYPDDGIYGEEHGVVRTDARHVWVLDPIDGTASFVTGRQTFGTLIAHLEDGVPTVGIIEMPALGERWVGTVGRASTLNGEAIKTHPCSDLAEAWLGSTSPDMFTGSQIAAFQGLRDRTRRTVWGGDCHGYGLLASGFLDVICEADMQPYDYLALVPVIEGAGGRCTDWQGNSLGLHSSGEVLASGDPRLHDVALKILNS